MQQWVDLARLTGLQSSEDEGSSPSPILEGQETKFEDSPETNKTLTLEQPSSVESLDEAEVKSEAEPTSAP